MEPRYSSLIGCNYFLDGVADPETREAPSQTIKGQIDDGRGVEGQQLAENQAADDRDAERIAQFGSRAGSEGKGQAAQQGRHGRHHDWTKTQERGLVDGFFGRLAFLTFCFQGEVDHHDGVLLHDADEQDDAYQGDDIEVVAGQDERQDCAHTGGRQRRENCDGMDVALVEDTQHDVDGHQGRKNQIRLARQRILEGGRRFLTDGGGGGRANYFRLRPVRGPRG